MKCNDYPISKNRWKKQQNHRDETSNFMYDNKSNYVIMHFCMHQRERIKLEITVKTKL